MTYPQPGKFPDFEQFMTDLLAPITLSLPGGTALTTLPAPLTTSNLPLIWVRNMGGTLDANAITYKAKLSVVVFGTTRSQAQSLVFQVRDAFLGAAAARTPAPNGVLIDYVEEIAGGEPKFEAPVLRRSRGLSEIPDLDPLNQMIELAFSVEARRQ